MSGFSFFKTARWKAHTGWAVLAAVGILTAGCSDQPTTVFDSVDPMMAVGGNAGWDLNDPLNGSLDVNGATWEWPVPFGVGTGQLNPFISCQSNGVEECFNSLEKFGDGKRYTNYTHDISLNNIPQVEGPSGWARELILDANEANSGESALFAIQIFDLWMCTDGGTPNFDALSDFQGNGSCKLVYGLGGKTAYATDEVTSGSGLDLDYRILIPEGDFSTAATELGATALYNTCYYQGAEAPSCGIYLVLHVKMGGESGWETGSTFEELSTIRRAIPGTLTLVKRIVNDNGGTAVVDDFNITSDAGAFTFGVGVDDGANTLKYTSNTIPVSAGTYSLAEDGIDGYTEGTWSCTGAAGQVIGTFGGGSVEIAEEENVVCTITNDDDPGSLTLVKRIINDDGGTAVVDDFGITTDAPGTLSFGTGEADGTDILKYTSNKLTVNAGTYTFSENDVDAYSEGTWSCSPTAATGTAYNAGSVKVANGVDVTCTITNNDERGSLTLVKRIVNDDGGTAVVDDFGITTDAPGTLSFGEGAADGANTLKYTSNTLSVPAGTYDFRENDVTGYTEGTWSCSPTNASGTAYNAGSVAVASGVDVVCTITNDDDPGSLTLVKRIVNDNGGTAVVDDFGITTDAPGTLTFGAGEADGTNTLKYTSNTLSVAAGTYNFSEMDLADYTEGAWSCSPTAARGTAYNAGSVDVANGVDVTCTITNNDIPQDETAWAANGEGDAYVGSLPYPGNNWATYVDFGDLNEEQTKTVTLFAGQTHDAGTVRFEKISDSEVEITVTLSGWSFAGEGMYNVMVNGYASTSELESNPAPGQFPYKFDAGASPYVFTVPLAKFYGVHAVVIEN